MKRQIADEQMRFEFIERYTVMCGEVFIAEHGQFRAAPGSLTMEGAE